MEYRLCDFNGRKFSFAVCGAQVLSGEEADVGVVHKEAAFTSEMTTQGLMWETVGILSKKDSWYRVSMEDGYEGWVHHFYLSEPYIKSQSSLTITNRCTPVHSQWGIDRQIMTLLSFGTVVPLIKKTSGYCKIQMINGEDGFIDYLLFSLRLLAQ